MFFKQRTSMWPDSTLRILLPFALAVIAACGNPPENPTNLPLRRNSIALHDSGALAKGYLQEPIDWQGIPIAGWLHLHPDGTLMGAKLSGEALLAGHHLPVGTTLWFDHDGHLSSCWLSEPTTIQGVPCKGGRYSKASTGFYPSGKLRTAFLESNTEVQGLPCKASVMHPLRFRKDGLLLECQLSREHSENGRRYRKGSIWKRSASEDGGD